MNIGTLTGEINLDDYLSPKLDLAARKAEQFAKDFAGQFDEVSESERVAGEEALTASPKIGSLAKEMKAFDGILGALGIHLGPEIKTIEEIGHATEKGAEGLSSLAKAGLVVGAGVAAWKVGRLVADFFDLDEKIANVTARALGFGDVVKEAGAATQDSINLAFERTGKVAKTAAEALKLNTTWFKEHQKAAAEDAKAVKEAAAEEAAALEKWQDAMVEVASAGTELDGIIDSINGDTVEAIKFYLEAGVSQGTLATAYGLTATQVKAVATELSDEADALKESEDAAKEAEKAHQTFLDALEELDLAGKGWKGTLNSIDGTVVEAIKFYMDAGVSQKALAEAYGLTDIQVRAVARAMSEDLKPAIDQVPPAMEKIVEKQKEIVDQFGDITTAAKEAARTMGGSTEVTAENFQSSLETSGVPINWQLAEQMAAEGYSYAEILQAMKTGRRPGKPSGNPIEGLARSADAQPSAGPSGPTSVAAVSSPGGVPGGKSLVMQPGAVVINWPIMNDAKSKDEVGRILGDIFAERMTQQGAL